MELLLKTSPNSFLSFLTDEGALGRPAEPPEAPCALPGLMNTGLGDIYVSEQ